MYMIAKMAHEKKKENFQRLREWDKRRAESLAIHRVLVESLQSEIDKRIKSSIENLDIYSTFFREKARQMERGVAYPVINTKCALQNNSISKSVFINCTVILNTLSDENSEKSKRVCSLIEVIRNDILRDSMEWHLQLSQKELLRVR
jgi:alpha-N-acetylglucosamine transferase